MQSVTLAKCDIKHLPTYRPALPNGYYLTQLSLQQHTRFLAFFNYGFMVAYEIMLIFTPK